MGGDLADEVNLLEAGGMVDAPLQDATAVTVGANSNAMLAYSIKDELSLCRLEVIQALLDDVVAIQILDEIDDLTRESLNDHLSL